MYVPSVFAISQPNLNEIAWNFDQSTGNYNIYPYMQFTWGNIGFIWYNKFYNKKPVATVWTSIFSVVDQLGPVFEGPVAVPEYLKWSRLVAVASFLVLRKKNRT